MFRGMSLISFLPSRVNGGKCVEVNSRLGFSLPFRFFGFGFWAFGINIRIGPVSGFG
jgi:hypothetical protein